MKNREPITATVATLHPDGYGLTADGKQAVIGALAGEQVEAEPWARKRRKHFYKARSVLQPSADRVEPLCKSANDCGGCSFQHFEPGAQILFKQQQLLLALGESQPQVVLPALTGPTFDYRSKARLGVKYVEKKARVLVGFREKMKPYIADIEACKVLRASVGERLGEIAELIESLADPRGIPQIEVAAGDCETALVIRHLTALTATDIERLTDFGRSHELSIYLQPGNESTVHKLFPDDGNERLVYSLPDYELTYHFHPLDFTQVNQVINQRMIQQALSLLALRADDRVLDAFCGIGNFSLPLARTVGFVLGIELSATSIERARENARLNGIENASFVVADLFADDWLSDEPTMKALETVNKVLLDPPRTGALAVCEKLARHKVERVVYVSCNPATLARDAEILLAGGYRLDSAGVIDMFPHTTHVESIACFSR